MSVCLKKISFLFCVTAVLTTLLLFYRPKYVIDSYKASNSQPPIRYQIAYINSSTKRAKPFAGILLTVNFNHPFYTVIPLLKEYFDPVVERMIFCGPETSTEYDIAVIKGPRGHYGYMCVVEGIKRNPELLGFLYVNDDMVVNWWNFVNMPRDQIWFGKDIENAAGANMDQPAPCCWHWWTDVAALKNCRTAFDSLNASLSTWNGRKYIETYLKNTGGARLCLRAWSDFMYIPHRLSHVFKHLAQVFYENNVFLEVAVSTIISALDKNQNRINLDGVYLPDSFGDQDFSNGQIFASNYDLKRSFYHPVKLSVEGSALDLFKQVAMNKSRQLLKNFENVTL